MSSRSTASTPDTMRGTALGELRDRVAAGMRAEAEVEANRCLPVRSKEAPASVDDFHPTIDELKVLARHWNRVWWDFRLFQIYYPGYVGSKERLYPSCRIREIEAIIGEQAMQIVDEAVDAEVRKEVGEEDWAAITGTADKAAQERFIERVKLKYERDDLEWEGKCREASVRDSRDDKGPEGESQPSE